MLHITVNAQSASAFLDRLQAVGANISRLMSTVARAMEQQARQAFRDQVDPWGRPWPPLAPSTLRARASRSASNVNRRANQQPLVDTGAMFGSLRSAATASTATVEIGAGLPDDRATVHQFGAQNAGRKGNVRIPARAYFPIRADGRPEPAQDWWATVLQPIDAAVERAFS